MVRQEPSSGMRSLGASSPFLSRHRRAAPRRRACRQDCREKKLRFAKHSMPWRSSGNSRRANTCSLIRQASMADPSRTRVPHSNSTTTPMLGKAARPRRGAGRPKTRSLAGVSGAAAVVPLMKLRRQPRKRTPGWPAEASGRTKCSNSQRRTERDPMTCQGLPARDVPTMLYSELCEGLGSRLRNGGPRRAHRVDRGLSVSECIYRESNGGEGST